MPENSSASSHERLLNHLRALGAAARTVEVAPHAMLRKDGVLATPEAVARVHERLADLEDQGQLLLGETTDIGVMVMLRTAGEMPVVLTAEKLVMLYGWMSEQERAILQRWEDRHLVNGGVLSTSDWPGWAIIYRRRYNPL